MAESSLPPWGGHLQPGFRRDAGEIRDGDHYGAGVSRAPYIDR